MTLFSEFDFCSKLTKALDTLGYLSPTDIQKKAIPNLILGRDAVISSKTGTGKTLCFLLPILEQCIKNSRPNSGARALILVPTRELALQIKKQSEVLAQFTGIKTGLVIGGEAFKHQVANIRRNPEIFIATPGRLVEHLNKGSIDFDDLETLVLDEADLMLTMGFSEDLNSIISACNKNRQIVLLSATLKSHAFKPIRSQLNQPFIVSDTEVAHSDELLKQQRILVDDDKHREKIILDLVSSKEDGQVIVFANTRKQVQKISNILQSKKIKSAYLHGELSQSERKQILNRFRQSVCKVLVASDVAARGIDIPDVSCVINFSAPHNGDEYLHRIGRTGRAKKAGKAITLVGIKDWDTMSSIERYLKVRLDTISLPGLKAEYKGPKKLKKSGKAASAGKRKKTITKERPGLKKAIRKTSKAKSVVSKNDATKLPEEIKNEGGWAPLRRK